MGFWQALGTGGRAAVLAAGGVAVAAGGYALWRQSVPAPVAAPATPVALVSAPEASPAAAEPEAQALPEVTQEISVDAWRVAADGAATVAGRAAPGALVRIMVDGVTVAEAAATDSGEFAALFTLAPNPAPSLMTLVAVAEDGAELPGKAAIALGPIAGPELVVPDPAVPDPAALDPVAAEAAAPEAAEAPVALMLTDEGAAVLQDPVAEPEPAQPDPAEAAVPVTVETISYTASGAVQLGGRGQGGAFLRIYIDNAPLQTLRVPDGGQWFLTLNEVPPGIYKLRVDQLDGAGGVTSRFETPFKRETLEALAAAAGSPGGADAGLAPMAEVEAETAAAPAAPEIAPAQADVPVPETGETAPVPEPAAEAMPEDGTAAPAVPAAPSEPAPITVTVQPGHTLWAIAKGQLGEGQLYVQVYAANREAIRDPDLIYPGQVFTIPQD